MTTFSRILKSAVTALLVTIVFSSGVTAQDSRLDRLFDQLAVAGDEQWKPVEQEILRLWSHSGSAAMDLLLHRGRVAMEAEDWDKAITLLSALVEQAPEFAEGWNARATAYYQKGLYGPSLNDIRHVLALNPRHFGALTGLAIILEDLGYRRKALEAYRKVLAIHPHRPNIKEAVERLEKELSGTDL